MLVKSVDGWLSGCKVTVWVGLLVGKLIWCGGSGG